MERSLPINSEAVSKLGSEAETLTIEIPCATIWEISNHLCHGDNWLVGETVGTTIENKLLPLREACNRTLEVP